MLCKHLMKTSIVKAYKHSSILDCAILMKENNIGFIPIVYPDTDFIAGVVTDRDILTRAICTGIPLSEDIYLISTNNYISCFEDADISVAVTKMADNQIKRILITNRQKQLCGIISLKEIATNDNTNFFLNDLLKETCENRDLYL